MGRRDETSLRHDRGGVRQTDNPQTLLRSAIDRATGAQKNRWYKGQRDRGFFAAFLESSAFGQLRSKARHLPDAALGRETLAVLGLGVITSDTGSGIVIPAKSLEFGGRTEMRSVRAFLVDPASSTGFIRELLLCDYEGPTIDKIQRLQLSTDALNRQEGMDRMFANPVGIVVVTPSDVSMRRMSGVRHVRLPVDTEAIKTFVSEHIPSKR